ncbi:TIGR02265 family protein [Archangium lansingense]|uniref:DUF2378 family protein n=1 Tax=Archangium lansingense TaxID=2995310 RepID=A0ABT4A6Q8_9BACT|nr:DUF2378 family protein [Archangium lansinium]MCY1076642.1 DUF2378 family protein [Archangium lansinium]
MSEEPVTDKSPPLGSEEELQWRLSYTKPEDKTVGVFFLNVMESVRHLGNEEAVKRCMEVSGESKFLEYFSYPLSTLLKMTYTAARLLSDKYGGFDKALWMMGYQAASGFYKSTSGRLMMMLNQGMPRQVLENMPVTAKTTWKDIDVSAKMTGPHSGIVIFKHDIIPRAYNEGAFQATFEAAQAKGVKVRARALGPLDTEYEITWD